MAACKHIICLFLNTLLLCLAGFANNNDTLVLANPVVIPGNFLQFNVDQLGNIYLINTQNQLKKLSPQLDSIAVFNDIKRLGNIDKIDVSNPLKTLVYYKQFGHIVLLDRFLNPRNTIDLRQRNLPLINSIAQSYDNQIWLFDEWNFSIKKMNDAGEITEESPDLRQALSFDTAPENMMDADGLLFTYHTKNGWKIFDYYGALKQSLAVFNWQYTQVVNGFLTGFELPYMHKAAPQKLIFQKQYLQNLPPNIVHIQQWQNKLYILCRSTGLYIFTI
jgi:hypothetical protein